MGLSSVSVIVSSLLLKRYRKPVLVDGAEADGAPAAAPGLKRPTIGARIGARIKSAAAKRAAYAFTSIPAATDDDAAADLDDLAVPQEIAMDKLAGQAQHNDAAPIVTAAPSSGSSSSSHSAAGVSRVEALRSHRLQSPLKNGAPDSRRT